MKFKNTFYNWLTNRFILIIRNEENFAIKKTLSFNYAKLLVVGIFLCAIIFLLSFYLITTILSKWANPKHAQMETTRKIILLSSKVDSLAFELERKDRYIAHFKSLMSGDVDKKSKENKIIDNPNPTSSVNIDKISPEDSLLRRKFEQEALGSSNLRSRNSFGGQFFFAPVSGPILEKYDPLKKKDGVSVLGSKDEPVKVMTDGQVIDIGNHHTFSKVMIMSHKHNILIKYLFKGQVLKKPGDIIEAGEAIGVIHQESPVNMEVWYEGRQINPEYFVKF